MKAKDTKANLLKKVTAILGFGILSSITLTGCSAGKGTLTYEFTGSDVAKAGYAEGTLTLTDLENGVYRLYWSDDNGALEGYYEIAKVELENKKDSKSFTFGNQTAIPADATKVIAVLEGSEEPTVKKAKAVYEIPADKQLGYGSKDVLYTFNSYSDIHIDEENWGETPAHYWEHSEEHWAKALEYSVKMQVDFIVTSGDQVTNAKYDTLDKEWKAYQYILAASDYVNPIYEAGGNHEIRQDGLTEKQLQAFMIGTGMDDNIANIKSGKPYYSFTEPKTGDLFIVMGLEKGYRPAETDEFSEEQLDWVEGLLEEHYGKGKNIYIIQHALMSGYGAGDNTENPHYGGGMGAEFASTIRFKALLEKYKDIIWISGHSHESFELGYNYSNQDGTSCHMIHNSSVSYPSQLKDDALEYSFQENASQGYYVQTFEKAIIFSGANLCDQKIYPAYSYIIDGNTSDTGYEEEKIESIITVSPSDLRSVMANAKSMLGVYYEYSSYGQYQDLKKSYYTYKDADIDAFSKEELSNVHAEFVKEINELYKMTTRVERFLKDQEKFGNIK